MSGHAPTRTENGDYLYRGRTIRKQEGDNYNPWRIFGDIHAAYRTLKDAKLDIDRSIEYRAKQEAIYERNLNDARNVMHEVYGDICPSFVRWTINDRYSPVGISIKVNVIEEHDIKMYVLYDGEAAIVRLTTDRAFVTDTFSRFMEQMKRAERIVDSLNYIVSHRESQ
jgi:hypothetical protein